ncbi:MAG: hypothetical protein KIS86_10575 [Devosia sp.]|nr:hypothetical protein [Devosia sp.]
MTPQYRNQPSRKVGSRTFICKLAAFGVAAIFTGASFALAQDDTSFPPLVTDLLPAYNLAQGSFPAVVGITPGITFAEAETILSPRVLSSMNVTEEIFSLTHPSDGRTFGLAFRTWFYTHLTTDVPKASDYFSATLTSGLTGGRIASITRRVSYSQTPAQLKPNFEQTVEQVVATYGQPSVQRGSTLYYLYWNGALDTSGSEARLNQCQYVSQRRYYKFDQHRTDKYPDCTALIEVSLTRDYDVSNLLREFAVDVTDYRRIFDDATMVDQYLLDGLNAAQGIGGGAGVSL